MMNRRMLLGALAGGTFAAAFAIVPEAEAQRRPVVIEREPPPPRDTRMLPQRRGYVSVPGHWQWRNGRHAWVPAQRVRERRGYRYENPSWQRDGERWRFSPGDWRR
ncbi:MAG: hypothetical protein V4653_13475 [Pseudomonadota bacterium]